MKHRVLVIGAGKIGTLAATMLADSGDYRVTLADLDPGVAAGAASHHPALDDMGLDASDPGAVAHALTDTAAGAVVCCLPWFANPPVAEAAARAGVHYFDLTEDNRSTESVRKSARGAARAFVPQCGLAPGVAGIAASSLASGFDEVDSMRLRVGALPRNPTNALGYALNWSTDGLINEYANPCEAIAGGARVSLQPLDGLERLVLDGVGYEAFNTSGGLGTLCGTWAGRVRALDYKTLRYPGHCRLMRFLMQDLRLGEDRDTLKRILERALPANDDDIVILHAAVRGSRDGRLVEGNFTRTLRPRVIAGHRWTAIQASTAAGACAVVDLVLTEPSRYHGFIHQEEFGLEAVLGNRFGSLYSTPES